MFCLLLTVAIFVMPTLARNRETGFLNRTITIGSLTYRYQVYVPDEWSQDKKWPVVLFLHGAGERGDDGLMQTDLGIGTAIRRYRERFPCIVVMPQCRKNAWWTETGMEAQALQALEKTMKEFNGDPQRVYLTGLSMGGYGTWSIAAKHPGKFAALVAICGGLRLPTGARSAPGNTAAEASADPYTAAAQKIGKTPVWVFHGEADPVVPVTESRKMVEALKAAGGNVRYTEYPEVKHNSWDKAYADPELLPWLLSHRLGNPGQPSPRK
jgi:predicted peptidase